MHVVVMVGGASLTDGSVASKRFAIIVEYLKTKSIHFLTKSVLMYNWLLKLATLPDCMKMGGLAEVNSI